MPEIRLASLRWRSLVPFLFLLFLLPASGCSDQAPQPGPAAPTAAANATADNATAAVAEPANATAAILDSANATAAVPEAANATMAVPQSANATAAAAPAKPAKSVVPAKRSASAKPAKSGKPAAPSGPLTLERARQEFTAFARQRLAVLSRNMLGNAARMAVTRDGEGYVARFAELDRDSLEMEVKATDTPSCPFVGVLKYFECSYESRGDSPDSAKSGTFSQVRRVRYTELFRHSGKRWE